jgi:hypothetical protein
MTLSPGYGRFVALALLLAGTWIVVTVTLNVTSARIGLHAEAKDLGERHLALQDRRVDIGSLEAELARLSASSSVQQRAITADSERAALARLQQVARRAVEGSGAHLLALNETAAGRDSSIVATQVRARIKEPALPVLLASWETGTPPLGINKIVLVSRARPGDAVTEIEISAVVNARWFAQKGTQK